MWPARSLLCHRCLKSSTAVTIQQSSRRYISENVLLRRSLAQKAWDRKAEKIKAGDEYNLWDVLNERGYIKDLAGTHQQIWELMRRKRIGAYVGVDPTAPSLHVGHLLPLMALFWMYVHGYRAHTIIGGATVKIGDPTDRLQAREKLPRTDVTTNITKMHYQMKRIWANVDTLAKTHGYEKELSWERALLNNSHWHGSTPFIQVVTRLFKGIRMGPLLSRDTVKRRLEDGGAGMPLDEFIYPLIQAWDWWHMYSSPKEILMQIGGSDQYGNIITGVEAVKYLRDTEPDANLKKPDDLLHTPVGFTTPLLTDSSGAKFGKSAGNAVWLDPFLTSSFDLYGYFMRRPDADVETLLKLLTFLPLKTIEKILADHQQDPSKRVAQHALAFEIVTLAHSPEQAHAARQQHRAVYTKGSTIGAPVPKSQQIELESYPESGPAHNSLAVNFKVDIELPESLILSKSLGRILYASGLASSVSDGARLTRQQGAYIAGAPGQKSAVNKGLTHGDLTFTPVKNWFPQDTKNFLIDGKLLILRRGKHFVRVVKMVSDAEWKESGRTYPGEPGTGKVRKLREALAEIRESVAPGMTEKEWHQFQRDTQKTLEMEEAFENGQLYIPKPDKS
ncbi:tRNA synthetase class I [Xylariales sp. PMI_506]|nr:tRNA synthetase class I [Xylariales sp. PMI_506]